MDLRAYLIMNEMTQEQFARKINVSLSSISKLCVKRGSSNLDLAILIVEATGGQVTYRDLVAPKKPLKKRKGRMKMLEKLL
jgi:DNA-binding XRE family transcriptional regulator